MLDVPCKTFIEELASKAPVPGGGGAAALGGAIGMALSNMVGNLTVGKKVKNVWLWGDPLWWVSRLQCFY